jgi:cytochrome oxidase assembly protein ShyY1
MTRRVPVVATIAVVLAVGTMVWLGVWQLNRAKWKEALLARYAAAETLPPIVIPARTRAGELPLFRHATAMCARVVGRRAQGGENRAGEPGYVQIFDCYSGGDFPILFSVEAGWSKDPRAKVEWTGGPVSGVVAPDRHSGMRLVASTAPAGLEPSRTPDVASASPVTPSGHRGYAATWFSLAAFALIIYALALRKRFKEQPETDAR